MKISSSEYTKSHTATNEARILPEGNVKGLVRSTTAAKRSTSPLEQGMTTAKAALESVPDIRTDIVDSLKSRIASGEYSVSGEDIAEMMLRRLGADKVR
jgi:negative regulator of flagellin synthesis FlgM